MTLGWNVIGAAVVIVSAIYAGSVVLAGFGIDSLIEIFASVVVVWQLKGVGQNRERRAMRLISLAYFALVIYVLIQSGRTLLLQLHAETSVLGIAWLAATLTAMLLLAWGKQGRIFLGQNIMTHRVLYCLNSTPQHHYLTTVTIRRINRHFDWEA